MVGHNTDMDGFLDPLTAFESQLKGADAMVFGSGGAQKAVSFALRRLGLAQVRVVSRHPDPSDEHQVPYSDVARFADGTTLFVNATPLGLPNAAERSPLDGLGIAIRSHQIGYDLLYKPRITPFLERFLSNRATAIGGMAMFIGQAKRSFELWTGIPMPEEATDVLL
jgi:shikimate dehydrogenase